MMALERVKVRGSRFYHLAELGQSLTVCGAVTSGPMRHTDKALCGRCSMTLRQQQREGTT